MADKIFIAKESTSQEISEKLDTALTILGHEMPKRYGYRVNLNDSNPATRVEYLYDAVGLTPATNNPSTHKMDLGGWADKWFVTKNHPCMLSPGGTEDYALDPNNYALKAGGGASDYNNIDYNGNAMAAIPTVWVKRYTADGYQYFICCEQQYDDSYEALAHIDSNGDVKPYAYMAMFEGYVDANKKLRSIAGKIPSTSGDTENTTDAHDITNQMAWAAANGKDFTITPWSLYTLIADLLTLMAKNSNCQAAWGNGYMSGGSSRANLRASGELYNQGAFYGNTASGTEFMKVFHIENYWAHVWKRAAGLFAANGGHIWAKMNQKDGPYATSIAASAGCVDTGYGICGGGGGYPSRRVTGRYGLLVQSLPGTITGAENTYEGDYHWENINQENVALLGGDCSDGA